MAASSQAEREEGSRSRSALLHGLIFASLALLAGLGCSVGSGEGQIEGSLYVEGCMDRPSYQLGPNFFVADEISDRLNLRIQRGSFLESQSDGLLIHVRDASDVRENRLGLPIAIDRSLDSPVRVTLILNESCTWGFPEESRNIPVAMEAHAGSITFDSIYAPSVEPAATEISAHLSGLRFESPEQPDRWWAVLDGWFSFFYQRGEPAQRFP